MPESLIAEARTLGTSQDRDLTDGEMEGFVLGMKKERARDCDKTLADVRNVVCTM